VHVGAKAEAAPLFHAVTPKIRQHIMNRDPGF
jgi:hypothetical protein